MGIRWKRQLVLSTSEMEAEQLSLWTAGCRPPRRRRLGHCYRHENQYTTDCRTPVPRCRAVATLPSVAPGCTGGQLARLARRWQVSPSPLVGWSYHPSYSRTAARTCCFELPEAVAQKRDVRSRGLSIHRRDVTIPVNDPQHWWTVCCKRKQTFQLHTVGQKNMPLYIRL